MAVITVAALVLRITWLLLVDRSKPIIDAADYLELGRTLAETGRYAVGGHRTAFRPVGYPFFLSLFFRLNLDPYAAARTVQTVLSALQCGLVFGLSLRMHGSLRIATVTAGAWALMPANLSAGALILSECLFTSLVLATLWTATLPHRWTIVLAGLFLGVACYVRPNGLLLLPCLFANQAAGGHYHNYIVRTCIAGGVVAVLAMPWALRNKAVFGTPALFSTNFGANFYLSHNPQARVGYHKPDSLDTIEAAFNNEAQASAVLMRRGLSYAVRHPFRELKLSIQRFFVLLVNQRELVYLGFINRENQPLTNPQRAVAWLNNLLYVAFLAGFFIAAGRALAHPSSSPAVWPLLTGYCLQLAFHALLQAQDRFMYPFTALVVIGGAGWLTDFMERLSIGFRRITMPSARPESG